MNNQPGISEEEIFAYIGRLTMRIQMLEKQLILLQQQIAQSQQAPANGKEPDESPEVATKTKV